MSSFGYDQFDPTDSETLDVHHNATPSYMPNRQNRRIYIMFSVLALFLLLLTVAVGVKFSQVNQQVSDVIIALQVVDASVKKDSEHTESLEPLHVKGPCQKDWLFYKNKCYFTSRVGKNWHDAEKNCMERSAHLAVVNDEAELEFLSQITQPSLSYWIGLVERDVEGNWSWVDGTVFTSSMHFWDDGQPDDWEARVNGEDCGQIHALQPDMKPDKIKLLNDSDCTLNFKYICEGNP